MSAITTILCDRCRDTVMPDRSYLRLSLDMFRNGDGEIGAVKEVDLCDRCEATLRLWLKKKVEING
jgi:hypothetical protein